MPYKSFCAIVLIYNIGIKVTNNIFIYLILFQLSLKHFFRERSKGVDG